MPALLQYRCPRCRHRNDRERARGRDERAQPTGTSTAVRMPAGPAAATEAFAWVNRQLSWQSTLADLEVRPG